MGISTCLASRIERRRSLPADSIVPDAMAVFTHAVTIDAPPSRVWPWLAQMGAGRGGWYSYDHIDNGGRPSARRILPEYQRVAPGDIFPSIPGARDAFVVAAVEPPRHLALTVPARGGGSLVSWELVLEPLGEARTRMIVRARVSDRWLDIVRDRAPSPEGPIFIERVYQVLAKLPRRILLLAARFGHRLMQARQLRGIKRRAEAQVGGAAC